jgi:diaminopimelate decarboxylase/aspartate kinase
MQKSRVVLKFGGTSVSGRDCWERIAERVGELQSTHRIWIVASALSQTSNHLERAIHEAVAGEGPASFDWIVERHRRHAADLSLDAEAVRPVEDLLGELERLLEGIRLTGEAPPRLRARVMSFGELASTRMGAAALEQRGLAARWVDARTLLCSTDSNSDTDSRRYLDARIDVGAQSSDVERVADETAVVLTQGFIARTARGETCLLGRGGSDISGALFAALLGAELLEIWTDVHGMFTADPRMIPTARLIRRIGYREAQELATMGAKVLHPRCLIPLADAGIPLRICNTFDPTAEGTRVAAEDERDPAVTAVVCRRGVTLLTLSTLSMWGAPGFLARAFGPFEELGVSVDLVATSQAAISVTLDPIPGGVEGELFRALLERLKQLGTVEVVHPCAVVSIVGRRIRTVLHELGPAMAVFREHQVHLVSESSEDLNLSFVVDEDDARPLVRNLHARLFTPQGDVEADGRFGDTWERLTGSAIGPAPGHVGARPAVQPARWWRDRKRELLGLVADGRARYVYDLATVKARASELEHSIPSVAGWYYSMKANSHPRVLETLAAAGFGLECVSAGEIRHARAIVGDSVPVLFTPNFCPPEEYAAAQAERADLTVDGPQILELAPELFRGAEIALRIDPGSGLGHHDKVRTAGAHTKFGHDIADLDSLVEIAERLGARVVGLHAHIGSGVFDPGSWVRTGEQLAELHRRFPRLRWLDVGGGLGVVERPGQEPLDLNAVEAGLALVRDSIPGIELRMEPGRYLVSDAGVLLAPVTQVRHKGAVRFAGVATGMNSLLRPALYGAWHAIHNLSRLDEPASDYWHVVGPICESSDVLGRDRLLPVTEPGDVLLVENCGAYGAAMASRYNLRDPAGEVALG